MTVEINLIWYCIGIFVGTFLGNLLSDYFKKRK